MNGVNDVLKVMGAMPIWALVTLVICGAFALAGYAIHVVAVFAKGRK